MEKPDATNPATMVEDTGGMIETTVSAEALAAAGNTYNNTLFMDSGCTVATEICCKHTPVKCRVKVFAGGKVTNLAGDLEHFGGAYLVDGVGVNLISFAETEDKYKVTYEQNANINVHLKVDIQLTLKRCGNARFHCREEDTPN